MVAIDYSGRCGKSVCIKSSRLWPRINKLCLKINMRVGCMFVDYIPKNYKRFDRYYEHLKMFLEKSGKLKEWFESHI